MRAAVIGCGVIAPMHVGSIAAAGGEVVQLCDIDTDKAARLRAAHCPGAEITADFDEALSRNPDVVHICTPHYLHAGMAEAALRRGINVFVEKPLCISVAELERISEAAARSSAQLGVCFQNRFTPAAAEAKRLAASVTAGYCSVQWKRDAAYYASAGWRGKKATEGGGVLINQAIHTLDLLLWLIGEPRFVTANVSNRTHAGVIDVEDTAEGLIEFDNCSAPFYATVSAAGSLPVEVLIEGAHALRYSGGELFVDGKPAVLPVPQTLPGKAYWGSAHPVIIKEFYDCVRSGRPFPVDVTEGGRTVRLLDAIYRSKGRRIQVQ